MSEKRDKLRYNILTSLTNKRFELILFPTEQCNFRCQYCYEDFKLPKMSIKTVESIKLFLNKRIPSLKLFELHWFGGEPLLEKKIVIEITKHAKSLCENYGVKFYSSMTTNGYLLDISTFLELNQLDVKSFQISFDGDQEIHNQYRKHANFSIKTFDKIWSNLLEINNNKELDFLITIRCHLTSINKESVQSLLCKINDNMCGDKRFRIHFKAISALGGKNDGDIPLLDKKEEQVIKKHFKQKFEGLFFTNDEKDYVCYASKLNSFLIRSNGIIGKCTVGLNDKRNKVGCILNDGTINIDTQKFLMWCKGIDTHDRDHLACPYYFIRNNKYL